MIKKIPTENAIGTVLAHDITRIIPGKFKGVAFKKGHTIRGIDIPELIKLGKRNLYILNLADTQIHEDEAALRITNAVCGDLIRWTDPNEGKSNMIAQMDGILKINVKGLSKINKIDEVIIATLKNNFPCRKDQVVAATRIIPLVINCKKLALVERYAEKFPQIIRVMPYRKMNVGGIVTGNEVYSGMIEDKFDTYVGSKVNQYGSVVVKKIIVPDHIDKIAKAINYLRERKVDVILITGGLSVDPDDVTRMGVRRAGAKIKFYGTPILPGAMFLYAKMNNIPVLGLPACIYYHPITIFDLTLPRILAGDSLSKSDFAEMGHGGLCMNCKTCQYPVCPFGK